MIDIIQMDRRVMLQRAFILIGASAIPADALLAAKSVKGPRFLNAARMKLLSALSDTMIPKTDTPGAVGAGVPAKLDGMLAKWASADSKKAIVEALDRIDAAAQSAKKKKFAALSATDRDAVLRPHDAAALANVPPPANTQKANPFAPVISVADNGYYKVKELIISLYYSSEAAMTQEIIYEHNPGVWQPSVKVDANTRPWASGGPF